MQQIINFILRNKTFLLFLLLFSISLFLTFQSHSYHKSKFINSANFLSGGVYESVSGIGDYFNLKKENKRLLEENNRLKSILFNADSNSLNQVYSDTSTINNRYRSTPALVIKNSYSSTNNYLTLNKGKKDSVFEDFGVITSKGIVGIIDKASSKYARVLSILNTNSRVNAQLKRTNHFGPLTWDGVSPEIVQLEDIQGLVQLSVGDTVTTSGYSATFPKGIPIGAVTSFKLNETEDVYIINVKLFNDMTNIGHVHIIENTDAKEISILNDLNE